MKKVRVKGMALQEVEVDFTVEVPDDTSDLEEAVSNILEKDYSILLSAYDVSATMHGYYDTTLPDFTCIESKTVKD